MQKVQVRPISTASHTNMVDGMTDQLKPVPFGLAAGILWGLAVFVTGIASAIFGYGAQFVKVVGSFYLGYEPTVPGSIIGGIWGFFDALIGGIIFAALYNFLAYRPAKPESRPASCEVCKRPWK